MDTSKEYIKMCEASEEIQDSWHMYNGDFFYSKNGQNSPEFCISIWLSGSNWCDIAKDKTWLPRQDQLQSFHKDLITLEEKLGGKRRISHLIYDFYTFVFGEQFADFGEKAPIMAYSLKFKSMEQMWLGFIMQEEYGKQWNGKEWVES